MTDKNFEDIFDDEFDDFEFNTNSNEFPEESPECHGKEDDPWEPRFPVDMDNPIELTDVQKDRAMRIYKAINQHMDEYPDEPTAPLILITQDWRVRVDFGGMVMDSDYRDTALCVMCHDEEGYYIDLDYVEQCVPYLEEELRKIADECMTMYGEVPDHHQRETQRVFTVEMQFMEILSDDTMKSIGFDNILIAFDTIEESVYPIPADMEHEDYDGIIQYIPADTLVDKSGAIDVDKIKGLVNNFLNPI